MINTIVGHFSLFLIVKTSAIEWVKNRDYKKELVAGKYHE